MYILPSLPPPSTTSLRNPWVDTEREIPLFQRLVFSDSEVKRFLEERLRAELSDLNLLSARDVMKSLGVGKATLKEWVRQGVLVGKRQMVYGRIRGLLFQKEMIDTFHRTYVLAKEAAELLDVDCSTIYMYVSGDILHPLGRRRPHLFLREEVVRLPRFSRVREEKSGKPYRGGSMAKQQPSFTKEFKQEAVQLVETSKKSKSEIARDLGISDSALCKWCKAFGNHGEQAFPGKGHQTAALRE